MESVELNDDQLGLHRTEQLRELYESLSSAGSGSSGGCAAPESNHQAQRLPSSSTALSPEDLTDTEWYFLVCMSFEFNLGQGLPGRSLSINQTIWLCNAHHADSTTFLRSLLAKSASIQTVVCFPYMGGVVEFGVTELVQEDRNLIQHIKSSFLDNPCPNISIIPCYIPTNTTNFKGIDPKELDEDMMGIDFSSLEEYRDLSICSPIHYTHGSESNNQENESNEVTYINGVASQVEDWEFMEEDDIIRSYTNTTSRVHSNRITNEKCDHKEMEVFDLDNDDVHYQNVLSAVLKTSNELVLGQLSRKNNKVSSFVRWKRERIQVTQEPRCGGRVSQLMLKRVLFKAARIHADSKLECVRQDESHGIQEKMNERFMTLGSLVPSIGNGDKLAILDGTIDYIKELKRRIGEVEAGRLDEARTKVSHPYAERIYGNHYINKLSRRKSREVGVREHGNIDEHSLGESSSNGLTISVVDKNVLIVIDCPWKEYVLNDIMDVVSDLHLEPHSVQSFNSDGNLSVKIKSQFKATKVGSASMIRQALHRVIHKC